MAFAVVAAAAVSAFNLARLPEASLLPVLLALLPWTVGKYVLCPLRWHTLSVAGQPRRWHLRVYAESELLGLLTPARAGTDLWRVHRLHRRGMTRPCAVADVALDRVVGAVGLTLFALLGGAVLPPAVLAAAALLALAVLGSGVLLTRLRPGLLAGRPLPRPPALARGLVLSVLYQSTVLLLLLGAIAAVGHSLPPLAVLAVFGASQIAGVLPGLPGAGPREGALVAGLVALGMPLVSALGAVSLFAVLAWVPALLFGGSCLLVRRSQARRLAAVLSTGPRVAVPA